MATVSIADLPASTKLAVERTRLAHERTLMAWVRTAASLISFGFTIYKFFEYLRAQQQAAPRTSVIGPREFALIMIGLGVLALVLATIGHLRSLQALRAEYGALVPRSLSTLIAGSMGLVGLLFFLLALFRE
jgi:putative membrane protein